MQQPAQPTLRYTRNEDGTPVPCPDIMAWHRWMMTADRRVCEDHQEFGESWEVTISTVFLGIDFGFLMSPKPILWETVVFTDGILPDLDLTGRRYTSQEDAIAGHQEICFRVANRLAATLPGRGR